MDDDNRSTWPTIPLGQLLTDIQPGFASGKHNSSGQGIPHFRPMNVSTGGRIDRTVLKFVDPSAGKSTLRLHRGDVVFNNTNSAELVGKTAFFDADDTPAFSNHMTRLRADPARLDADYLALRLHFAWRAGWFEEHCNNHVSQASIGREVLQQLEIELPPLEMQKAISALNRELDGHRVTCDKHLQTAKAAIARFKHAVLVVASTGRLTMDWRDAHPSLPSVEQALANLPARKRSKKSQDGSVDLELPELPDNYAVATIGQVAQAIEYGTSDKLCINPDDGIPVLRMGNIQDGKIDLSDLKYHPLDKEVGRFLLQNGDLLFNRTNSPELVGKSAVYHGEGLASFASYLIRVRLFSDACDPDFANYWINSAWGRAWAHLAKTDGVSQSNINGTKLAAMPIPLPPIEEQREIVRRASRLLATADTLLVRVKATSRAVDRTSQAVLAKAFRGDLITTGA